MPYRTLITTEQLAASLEDPAFVIVDCRFLLTDVEWGRRVYLEAHIPGARYAHLDDQLSGPKTGTNGRHPLPDPDVLAEALGRLGIERGRQVAAYDQDTGMYASRLWWLLRWLGHDEAAVLDGGFAKWLAEGRPTRAGEEAARPARFTGTPRPDMTIAADGVEAVRSSRSWRLIDARAPERYRGETEPYDRVAGHIPGAMNRPLNDNLTAAGTFKPAADLRAEFASAAGGVSTDHVIAYCGSGVTASHHVLALELAGLHGARLYPGSWSEWSSDPSRPVATGEEQPGPSGQRRA
jgi:thiosulfate/3-mercaptopyruvate sulfurtransferase